MADTATFSQAVGLVAPDSPAPEIAGCGLAPGLRFQQSYRWRFIITDLNLTTITVLDRLASSRAVTKTLDDALQAVLRVPSDNPRVNIPYTDLDPKVGEGTRCLIGFRHEDTSVWVPRASTIIFQAHDAPDGDVSRTEITGWDPWRYLDLLPIINLDAAFSPGAIYTPGKFSQSGAMITTIGDVVVDQLSLAESNYNDVFIDYGQTGFASSGIIESVPLPHPISFQNGSSVGQMLRDLCARGWCDIDMDPIYDPANRPGILVELNLFELKGSQRNTVVMAWDTPPRTVTSIDRLEDGTQRANSVQFFHSRGGPPVALKTDPSSQAKFRRYCHSRYFPMQGGRVAVVEDLAVAQLLMRADTLETITVNPTPERAKVPLVDYSTGDTVRVASSRNLRKEVDEFYRVIQIPLVLGDNSLETVAPLTVKKLVCPDEPLFTEEGPDFYDAAYDHNAPFAIAGPYQTTLTMGQEADFRDWLDLYDIPFDPDADPVDYDMRGYWSGNGGTDTLPTHGEGDRFPDDWKTPYDTSFSNESMYATSDNPFSWEEDILIDERDGSVVCNADWHCP